MPRATWLLIIAVLAIANWHVAACITAGASWDSLSSSLGLFSALVTIPNTTWFLAALAVTVEVLGWFTISSWSTRRSTTSPLENQQKRSRRWAQLSDVPELRVRRGESPRDRLALGVLFGEQLWVPRWRSKLVLAPTRAGKSARVVVPDVLRHVGPVVVTSIKSDVLHLTRYHRAKQGPVMVFDPTEDSGVVSCRWSPLLHVHDWTSAVDAAGWLTATSRKDVSATANDQFWTTTATTALAPMILAAHLSGKPLAQVGRWVQAQNRQAVSQILSEAGEHAALAQWQVAAKAESMTQANIFTSLASLLAPWMHPVVARATDTRPQASDAPVLSIRDLVHGCDGQHGSLYLVATPERQETLAPIFETMVTAIASEISRSYQRDALPLDPPLLMMLDEAANICRVRDLPMWASAMAGQGMILVSVWQDHGQIESNYGPAVTRTIISNHTAHVMLSGISDDLTLRNISERVGSDEFLTSSTTRQHHSMSNGSTSHQWTTAKVAETSKINEFIPDGGALAFVAASKPMKVRLPGWWENPELTALVDPQIAARMNALYASESTGRRK